MTESLLVVLDDVIAGTLERLPGGRLRFDYTEEYRERPGATPVSISMPPQVRSHSDRTITSWLWGLLPDNDAVLARWARQFHVSSSSPFSLLATQIGEDCAGAVRLCPPEEIDRVLARQGGVTWLTEDEVGTAPAGPSRRLDVLAWPVFHRPVQPCGSPGEDGSALQGWALGCSLRLRRHYPHPQAGGPAGLTTTT